MPTRSAVNIVHSNLTYFTLVAWAAALVAITSLLPTQAHADSTGVIPGDGPQCVLSMPGTATFNTTLTNALPIVLTGTCTRYPVKWEWTGNPLSYGGRNMTGDNYVFQPLFDAGIMTWTYDNRKVTTTNTITLTFNRTGTFTYAVRAKDADYIPPNNRPAGFWGPWGAAGASTIDSSGAWRTITLTCSPLAQTRVVGPGGTGVCTGGQIPSTIETRTFCADSISPIFGPWIPNTSCACPVGTLWNGTSCVAPPVCTVAPNVTNSTPGQAVTWITSCDTPPTTITWRVTSPPPPTLCVSGATCVQTYVDPRTVCYAVTGTNTSGTGPESPAACVSVACPAGQSWSGVANACGIPPTITGPTFVVGILPPATITPTVTGTPTITCSASALPPGWTMNPVTCVLSTTSISTPQPPVPLGCSVTAVNAWGSATQACIAVDSGIAACEAHWQSTPFVLSQSLWENPKAPTAFGLFIDDATQRVKRASYGDGTLTVTAANNPNQISVECDGSPQITAATISTASGLGSANVRYIRQYALTPFSYLGPPGPAFWVSQPGNNSNGQWVNPPLDFAMNVSQAETTPPANPVCRVTVRNSTTGVTGTCASPATQIITQGEQLSCGLTIDARTANLPNGSSVPFDNFGVNAIYGVRLEANAYLPGPSAGDYTPYSYFAAPLSCQKRVRNSATPLGTWQAHTLGGAGGPIQARFINPSTGKPVTTTQNGDVNLDSFDASVDDYDLQCTYSGVAYDPLSGVTQPVSCGAWYSYRTGAACGFQGDFTYGPTGITYDNGTTYSGYNAGFAGKLKFLGEKVDHVRTVSSDRDYYFEIVQPGNQQLSSRTVVLTNKPVSYTDYWGSSAVFLRGRDPVAWPISNALRAGENLISTPIGVNAPQLSTDVFAGCTGLGFGTGYFGCGVQTDFRVKRTLFDGRQSTGSCYVGVGSDVNYTGGAGGSNSGSGTGFGPGAGSGTTGGTGGGGGSNSGSCTVGC